MDEKLILAVDDDKGILNSFSAILKLKDMTITGSNGQSVTIHAFNTSESMATKGDEMFFALWDLDQMNS